MSVVSNTSPLNYLVLIGQSHVLPVLYNSIIVSNGVVRELQAERTPALVREWISKPPPWLEIRNLAAAPEATLGYLGIGESETISLAKELNANATLIDDRDARREAERRQITVIGTLGVIVDAADLGLLKLEDAIRDLQKTTFRVAPRLIKAILDRTI